MRRSSRLLSVFSLRTTVSTLLFFSLVQPFISEQGFAQQEEGKTLLMLLEEENPLSDLIYDLEDRYEPFNSIIETERRRLQAEKDKAFLEIWEQIEKEMVDLAAQGERNSLADLGRRMQGVASEYNLEALFPGAPEERLQRCRTSLEMARLQLETAQGLEAAYVDLLEELGFPQLAAEYSSEGLEPWRMEIEGFECVGGEERPPLRTEVVIPPLTRRPFVLKTFCIDRNRLGPGSGQPFTLIGHISDLGRNDLAKLLSDFAADPSRGIDIQRAIWDGEEEETEGGDSLPAAAGWSQPEASISLNHFFFNDTATTEIYTREDFSSVEIWIENPGDRSRTVNLSGSVLDSGDSGVQRLVSAGIDDESPPPGPKLKDPEQRIREILKRAEEWLRRAQERVRNGDHSPEALGDLVKAMGAAEGVGFDLEDADWDLLRDGIWEETELTYKVYKANPTAENRKTLIESMKAMDYVDPPEGKEEAFSNMMEDIAG